MNPKSRCLIVSANEVIVPYPVFPLGAAYVAGALNSSGHEVVHFDCLAQGGIVGLENLLQREHFDLIGISIRNIDTVDSADPKEYLKSIQIIATRIRELSHASLVLGGPAFSIMPNELLEYIGGDYGVVGEGEKIMVWLASELAEGRKPVNQIFHSDHRQDTWLPSKFFPEIANYYTARGGMLNVQSKRGCPHLCSYCTYPTIEGNRMRYRDPEEVAEEVFFLEKEAGAKFIFFVDSVFNDSSGHHLKVAEALVRRGCSLPWCGYFRPQNVTKKELRLLKRAGLDSMEIGTDAATDKTLAGLNKKFLMEDVFKTQEIVLEEEISSAHFIVFGGPNEDAETLREGLANVEKLDGSVVFAFIGIRVLPGTTMYDRALEDGMITSDQDLLPPTFYYSPHITRQQIHEGLTETFDKEMSRIYPCHEAEKRIVTLHGMGHVGPLWDLLLK